MDIHTTSLRVRRQTGRLLAGIALMLGLVPPVYAQYGVGTSGGAPASADSTTPGTPGTGMGQGASGNFGASMNNGTNGVGTNGAVSGGTTSTTGNGMGTGVGTTGAGVGGGAGAGAGAGGAAR